MTYIKLLLAAFSLIALFGCATTSTTSVPGSTISSTDLALITTGATIATGAVLQYAEPNPSQRSTLANEIYSSANAANSLTTGTIPTSAQINAAVLSFAGSNPVAAYTQYASSLSALYQSYFSRISGNSANAIAILEAIAKGAQIGAQAYITTPFPSS